MAINQDQFLEILDRHKGILFSISNIYASGEEDRKDLIQEMTLQIWRSFEKYDSQFQWSTFIYRIAINVGITFYRKQKKRKYTSSLSDSILNLSYQEDFQSQNQEEIALLYQFIEEMRPLDKALMILYLDETSTKEISQVIGISETNVTSKIFRLKKQLKARFDKIKN